jgi:hypothetical protein
MAAPISSDFFFSHQSSEMFKGPIVGPLSIPWKTTTGQLAALDVILQALTANALSGTWVVAAVAFLQIPLFVALHSPAPHVFLSSLILRNITKN